jgi:site-specific recombinase XerD
LDHYVNAELSLFSAVPPTETERRVAGYAAHLANVRGLAPATVEHHRRTATEFLAYLAGQTNVDRLATLSATDVEGFVGVVGQRVGRRSLQGVIGALRSFLRFLVAAGAVPPGLDQHRDAPRVYREERLPRALPWEVVQRFLRTIDRTTARGRRDYAIFLLIATYGLRASDVAALTLDDIEWRARRIRVRQRKTGTELGLPLTDDVGTAVLEYLQRGRSSPERRKRVRLNVELCQPTYRQVFLRCRRPAEPLGPTALSEAFYVWAQRSGLAIPFHGVHCLRHSYAVHLLRTGTSLKTIGDLLGHRTPESTYVYLRLDIDDLRDVALAFPYAANARTSLEVAR